MRLHLATSPQLTPPGGATLPLQPRDAALLAWLALEGPTPRNRLAQLLWPASEAKTARNALRQRLFRLRRQFGDETLITGETTLALAGGVTHDLDEADDVLVGVAHELGPELTAWLEQQRERRRSRLHAALAELCDGAERAGDFDDALSHAKELLALQPLSEDAHRRLIRLHYLRGDRAAALLAFDHCERVLKDEIGAAPSAATLALLADIEDGSAGDDDGPAHVLPAALLRPPRDSGREAEHAALRSAWQAGAPFLLLGEPGIGKSRAIDRLAASWPGAQVVRARPGDAQAPLAVVARLVELLCAGDAQGPHARAAEALRAQLAGASDDPAGPGATPGATPGAAPAAEPPAPRQLAAPLRELLQLACGTNPPLALLLDDWQFADQASVALLGEVLAAPELAALRVGHASRTGAGALAEQRITTLVQHSQRRVVVLAPLDGPGATAFVASLRLRGVAAEPLAQALLRRVGGNPLYLLEALRQMHEHRLPLAPEHVQPSRQVAQLVASRIAELPDAARQLLRVAAVAGTDFDVPLAEAVSGRNVLELSDAWGLLEQHGLFDERGVAHDLYTEAALATLPAPIARTLHARVAATLEGRSHDPARVAAHWRAGGDDARAVPHLLAAARQAWGHALPAETLAFHRQAAGIDAARGHAAQAFGHWFDCAYAMAEMGAVEQFDECLHALERAAVTPSERLRVRLAQAVSLQMRGAEAQALSRIAGLLTEAIALGDLRVECESRYALVREATADGRFDEALQQAVVCERLLREAGQPRRASALAGVGARLLALRGQPRQALQQSARVLPQLQQLQHRASWTMLCCSDALQHLLLGDTQRAGEAATRALQSARQTPISAMDLRAVLHPLVEALRWSGRFDEALAITEHLLQRLPAQGLHSEAAVAPARLYLHLGRPDLAHPLIETLLGLTRLRERERERQTVQLLAAQAASFTANARIEWPDDALASEDLALAAEWALCSGLVAASPWPSTALRQLLARCEAAEIALFALPLRALVARRLVEAGQREQADPVLAGIADAPGWSDLHAATPCAALFAAHALQAAGHFDAARATARRGTDWLVHAARTALPEPFRDSFLNRNPTHRQLLALAGHTGAA
ncbi:MAG: AAA family ATPase [Burkholderiaceae bacterium]|nr:AAA family ATPase [Burkholderiaceae bacterium]